MRAVIKLPEGERFAAGRGNCSRGAGGPRDLSKAVWGYELDQRPWFTPVADHQPVALG